MRAICRMAVLLASMVVSWPPATFAGSAVVAQWNEALLEAVMSTRASDVATARALVSGGPYRDVQRLGGL
jgi:hypothetical protein